jgi:hypothetical protein
MTGVMIMGVVNDNVVAQFKRLFGIHSTWNDQKSHFFALLWP